MAHELQSIIRILSLYQSVASNFLLGLTFSVVILSALFPFDRLMKLI